MEDERQIQLPPPRAQADNPSPTSAGRAPSSETRISVVRGNHSVPLLPGEPVTSNRRSPWKGVLLEKHRVGAVEIPEHEHHTFCLHLQTSGPLQMDWSTGGRTGRLQTDTGNLIFLPPGTRDSILWHGPSQRIIASIDPSIFVEASTQLEMKQLSDFEILWSFYDDQLRLLLTEMEREAASNWSTGPLYGDLLGLSLSIALIRKYGRSPITPAPVTGGIARPQLRRVLEFIEANLSSEIHLEQLAKLASLSVYHFARAFRRSMGVTPHQYLLQRRIDSAKTLLRQPNSAIDAVADATGFADASHFSKTFHKHVGVTPKNWKQTWKQNWKQQS
jgi:AraC family transcriptional regulator